MCSRDLNLAARPVRSRSPAPQFAFQMRPFEEQLTARFGELAFAFADQDFCAVEFIAAAICLVRNFREIIRDGSGWRSCGLKSAKLRMTSVASRLSEQNFLRQ